ncbi:MAG: hypothetical protein ACK6BG_06465 [Cyanobacteriota bacterium]
MATPAVVLRPYHRPSPEVVAMGPAAGRLVCQCWGVMRNEL